MRAVGYWLPAPWDSTEKDEHLFAALHNARLRRSAAGTVLHLINHRWNSVQVRPEPWDVLSVDVLSVDGAETSPPPLGAFVVATEWPEQRPVTVTTAARVLTLRVPGLNCNTL